MGEPIAPTSLPILREWIQAGRLDALAVRGWLIQGYRVLARDLSFDDFLTGLKAVIETGYQMSPGDYRWLVALAAALEYFYLRTDQAVHLLTTTPPSGINDQGELDGLVPARSVMVAHWLGSHDLTVEPNHEMDMTWLDLPEVESVISIGLVDITQPRWHWLADAVNNPLVEPHARLATLREVGVKIVDFTTLINAGAVNVIKSLLVEAPNSRRRDFWRQWLSTYSLREGVVGHLLNWWVGAAVAPLAPISRFMPRSRRPQLPPHLETQLWGHSPGSDSPRLDPITDPVQLYRSLSISDPLDVSWNYLHRWRIVIKQMTDRNALEYFIARAYEYLHDRNFQPTIVMGAPAFNDIIIAMLHQRQDELTCEVVPV